MVFSCILAFLLSLAFCPLVITLCRRNNWYDEVDPRKIHTGNIPRLGGVALFASFAISLFVFIVFFRKTPVKAVFPLYIAGGLILLCGILDDFFNLRAKLKFLVQIIAALIVACSPTYFDHLLALLLPPVVGRLITFVWIISIVNAFNLIDGMDWLCGGISFLSILTFALIGFLDAQNIASMHFILSASLLGFLFWNKPSAKIFLGDGGSQSLGYIIAVTPLFYSNPHAFSFNQCLVMLLVTSIPVFDVIAAIWRRKREHRAIFAPDRAHIHHKLLNIGFSKLSAIFFLLLLQVLICLVVFATYFMPVYSATVLLLFAIAFVSVIFITFHYLNRSVNLRHLGHLEDRPQREH